MENKVSLLSRLNPIRWLLTKAQREAIYGERVQKPVVIPKGFKLIEFIDKEKNSHRFLYKEPKGESLSNMFFGGSDLNINDKSYKSFFKEMESLPEGFIVPIYPGYHELNVDPSENKIQNSCLKIFNALNYPKDYKFSQDGEEIILRSPTLKMNLIGYSLGAPIAAEIAAEKDIDQKVGSLTLMAPPVSIRDFSVECASQGQSPFVGKIFNFFSKGFGENYNTVDSLKKLDEKVNLTIISSNMDQFNQARLNKSESHLQEIHSALEGRDRCSTIMVNGVYHANFLNSEEIKDKLKEVCCKQGIPPNIKKSSVIAEAVSISQSVIAKKYHVVRKPQRTM